MQTIGIDFNVILKCLQEIKEYRQNNESEQYIYHTIKHKYGNEFHDIPFTLNTLLQIEYNSDDDKSEPSLTSGTTTSESLDSSDCCESDHSSD
jgi:hypothetical protein